MKHRKKRRRAEPWRGFASMTKEERTTIARLGGIAAQERGVGHSFTPEEAVRAGKKGVRVKRRKRKGDNP